MAPIFLDCNSTTPVAPEVVDSMLPYLREHFGNPSSRHVYGVVATLPVNEHAGVDPAGPPHAHGALLHTDAAQSVGKVPVDVTELAADLLTIAGHKMYAPKGVGALYVRQGIPLQPILHGAGHERGLRPGTEAVPQIVALGAAARLAHSLLPEEGTRLQEVDQAADVVAKAVGPSP